MSCALDIALEYMFGAPAKEIHVTGLDHLCITLTPEKVTCLLRAAGGDWRGLLLRIDEKRDSMKDTKSPGEDVRNK